MSRYDGLIIPRSYSEYINKTDAATLQQALQLSGVLSGAVAAGDNKAVTSNAVNGALATYGKIFQYNLGALKIISHTCKLQHIYRITMCHPSIPNKAGHYIAVIQNPTLSKIENLTSQNNYIVSVNNLDLTVESLTNYGLVTIEDLGLYN